MSLLQYLNKPNYIFDPNHFLNFFYGNRNHQKEAWYAASNNVIGQILSPCGTGKTRIQACVIAGEMIKKQLDNKRSVSVIASHRLALNRQLAEQILELVIKCHLPIDVLFVGSDRINFNRLYTKYNNIGYTPFTSRHLYSLSKNEIANFVQVAKEKNRHVFIISTYHSFDCLENIEEIDIATFDEAHTIASNNSFKENISKIFNKINKKFFFTATRKVEGESGGMNDKSFFGDIIYDADPSQMIIAGEIVSPKLHTIGVLGRRKTGIENTEMLIKNTLEAFTEHRKHIKKNSSAPDLIGAKLLVSCVGISEMNSIATNKNLLDWAASNNISILSISSDGQNINGEDCGKSQLFDKMNSLKDNEDAIILNVDMLTEGIDLPSITGVMPLRDLGPIKLIQLLGRCLRLFSYDRAKLYNKEMDSKDLAKFVKPHGYLIIPKHLTTIEDYDRMVEIAKNIYEEYKTPVEEFVIQEKYNRLENEHLNSMIPFQKSSGHQAELVHEEADLISSVYLKKREEDLAKILLSQDRIEYLWRYLNVFKE